MTAEAFRITFTVPGDPIPQPRPRVTEHGVYYPERARGSRRLTYPAYKELIQAWCLESCSGRIHDPSADGWGLEVVARLAPSRGDADKILATYMDALEGILWENDKLVLQASVRLERVGAHDPRNAQVTAWVLEE